MAALAQLPRHKKKKKAMLPKELLVPSMPWSFARGLLAAFGNLGASNIFRVFVASASLLLSLIHSADSALSLSTYGNSCAFSAFVAFSALTAFSSLAVFRNIAAFSALTAFRALDCL